MSLWVYSYNAGSQGAKDLAQSLGIRRIKAENSRFVGGPNKTVINWGSSNLPDNLEGSPIINKPRSVALATNKLTFFNTVRNQDVGINTPEFTTSFDEAVAWLAQGHTVVARTQLQGHSGSGIVMMEPNDPTTFVRAPLYTKYIKKISEYRVHVVLGEVIDVQKKVLQENLRGEVTDFRVRSYNNGFIFMREGVEIPDNIKEMCRQTIDALGLDFGAVDLIYNRHQDRYYVLEVNTAPGLTGTTLTNYAAKLAELRN